MRSVRPKRVVVAMSGGVDSSVTAALLRDRGYEVIGVTMQLWPELEQVEEARRGGCCSLEAVGDARRVAERLGIRHYVLSLREAFEEAVVDYFVAEYAAGRTPNPCIACNRWIKFTVLMDRARALGADYLATGHYARVFWDEERRRWLLARGVDAGKDQSYVLYGLTQEQMSRLLLPLGDLTKEEVRALARRYGLPVADKPESQEICFVEEHYGNLVAARMGGAIRPGPIVDRQGRVLGTHRGLAYYTVGQRRGLGVGGREPLYVLELDPRRNALVVGPAREAWSLGLAVSDVNLILWDAADLQTPGGVRARVQIRYRAPAAPAVVRAGRAGLVHVVFDEPQWAVTPGQAAVFYVDDLVAGGGTIEASLCESDLDVAARVPDCPACPANTGRFSGEG